MKRKSKSGFKSSVLKKRDSGAIKIKPLVIISCEGTKTEPNYLKSIINLLIQKGKIARGSVVIADHQHTDPLGVLNDLINYQYDYSLFEKKWIVIDRDEVRSISSNSSGHPEENFVSALNQEKALELLCKDGKIKANTSVDELKAIDNLYDILLPRKENGFNNLKKLMNVQKGKTPVEANPGTRFHELVEVLEKYDDEK